jgi:lipoprotein-releasing system permease protein
MKNNIGWVLYVAGRYFRTRRKDRGHLPSILSIVGIAVGVMTMIAVLAVMNGFQMGTIESILELNSYHIRVSLQEREEAFISELRSMPGIRSVLPFAEMQTLVRGVFAEPRVGILRIVPEDCLDLDNGMREQLEITRGEFDIHRPFSVVLGSELARFLGVQVGEKIKIINLTGRDFNALRPREDELLVSGIFKTGYYNYDVTWGFVSFGTVESLYGEAPSPLLGVKLENRYKDQFLIERIRNNPNLKTADGTIPEILSWREFNRAIFGALRMEKTVMMFLIALIFLVVAANIFQSHRRNVYERSEDIGVLRVFGAPPGSVRLIFVLEGFFIGLIGGVCGLILGLIVSENINAIFGFAETAVNFFINVFNFFLRSIGQGQGEGFSLFSPAYFYLIEVPSKVLPLEALSIFLLALFSTTAAAFFASYKTATVRPAEVLRYE